MSKRVVPVVWTGEEKEVVFERVLDKRGEELVVLMLLLGKGDMSTNVKVNIRHVAADTTSRVIVKGVLTDQSRVEFDGLVKIERGAKGANAWLGAHLLLLSARATGRAVPNLEIEENEVKAGHGATVGKIDEMQLFYLMSRGVSKEKSVQLVVQGFLESLISQMPGTDGEKIKKQISWIA